MLIVISGKSRSGKDLTASYLDKMINQHHDFKFIQKAYADDLKQRIMSDFDMTYEQLYGDLKETPDKRYPLDDGKNFWTPRDLMQYIGSDVYRKIDPYFWIKQLQKYIKDNPGDYIITDGRYINEVSWVLEQDNNIHIRVNRDFSYDKINTKHSSEVSLDNFDMSSINNYKLSNLGSKLDLYMNIKNNILPIILNKLKQENNHG